MVLFLLNREEHDIERFCGTLLKLRKEVNFCKECGNISDAPLCSICTSAKRYRSLICVLEDSLDLLALDTPQQYNGLYYVLLGLISPLDGFRYLMFFFLFIRVSFLFFLFGLLFINTYIFIFSFFFFFY